MVPPLAFPDERGKFARLNHERSARLTDTRRKQSVSINRVNPVTESSIASQ